MKNIYCVAKYSLAVFHFMLSCIGIAIVAFGCSILRNLKQVNAGALHYEIPMVLISVGMVLVFFSMLGVIVSFKKCYWLTTLYSTLLLAVFCGQIVLIAYVAHMKNGLANDMSVVLHRDFKDKIDHGLHLTATPMDVIQSVFKCCGKRSFLDYMEDEIPLSCCHHSKCVVKNIYRKGCNEQFAKFWMFQAEYMEVAGIFLAVLELFGVVIAFVVSRSCKKEIRFKDMEVELVPAKILAYD